MVDSTKKWKYLSIGLMAVLATGFSFPQAFAHITTDTQHMLEHIYKFARNIQNKVTDIGSKVDGIKTNTDLLSDPGFGLQEIKREVRDIEDRLDGIEETLGRIAPDAVETDDLSIGGQISLKLDDGLPETFSMSGPLRMKVFFEGNEGVADDDDGDGLDEVPLEIVQMTLTSTGGTVPVEVSQSPARMSLGFIEENVNVDSGELNLPPFNPLGPARMAAEMFVIVEINGTPFHNVTPVSIQGLIDHKPPACGDELDSGQVSVPLFDASDKQSGWSIVGLVLNQCQS